MGISAAVMPSRGTLIQIACDHASYNNSELDPVSLVAKAA